MGVLRKTLNWYAKLSPAHGKAVPPYGHVVQIGDPMLRKTSEPVLLEKIKTDEVQKVIAKLNYVLFSYGSVGMAAPQIGVNMRIFVMRYTEKQLSTLSKDYVKVRGITVVPHIVFINPKLKVVDFQKVVYSEGCESMRGYEADVPRYKEVEVSGYNHKGEATTHVFKDWAARIAQHEYDHLDGKLYVDTMDRRTIHCTCWEEVNLSSGKVVIPLSPE